MASTYTLISSQVLGSSAASVTFSSIPQTYKDLVLNFSVRSDRSGGSDYLGIAINSNSSSIYSYTDLNGVGSGSGASVFASSQPSFSLPSITAAGQTTNVFASGQMYIPNYVSGSYKPINLQMTQENNGTVSRMDAYSLLFSSTATISSLVFNPVLSTNFLTGSSFYLYGI